MKNKEMVCIVCPVGCHLSVDKDLVVSGNKCRRGAVYAIEEMTQPKRVLTTTVKTTSMKHPRVSVKSNKPLDKKLIFEAIDKLSEIILDKDVKIGDIIIKNICSSDCDIVATKQLHL